MPDLDLPAGQGGPAVRAAGVVPWRIRRGDLQVAVVHRPRYDDWSWPKGKLDRGEDWAAAAARETREETGWRVRLGLPLPTADYRVGQGSKLVHYWAAEKISGNGALEHEIDEVRWVSARKAAGLLSYPRDRDQLAAVVIAHEKDRLRVWPLLIVRHAKAIGRGSWDEEDELRPLDAVGRRRAARLVPLLDAYAPVRLVSSPSLRCYDTLVPYAVASGLPMTGKAGLSEEGHEANPQRALNQLDKAMDAAEPIALCTHGPVLGGLLTHLAEQADGGKVRKAVLRLARSNLDKGEILACSVVGSGDQARVVAIDRHRPPRG